MVMKAKILNIIDLVLLTSPLLCSGVKVIIFTSEFEPYYSGVKDGSIVFILYIISISHICLL